MEIKFLFSLMKICFNLGSQNIEVFSPKMGKMLILAEADSNSCPWREGSSVLAYVCTYQTV